MLVLDTNLFEISADADAGRSVWEFRRLGYAARECGSPTLSD
jgi:hypothetical protein